MVSSAPPFYARSGAAALGRQGMIHGATDGRADRRSMAVGNGSYVIPAYAVSSIGGGNSMAGANAFNRLFKMGPYGSALPGIHASAKPIRSKFAGGGPVDIAASDGEFVVPPDKVAEIGGGDVAHGHKILDAMVNHIRGKTIKTLRKQPGPKKK